VKIFREIESLKLSPPTPQFSEDEKVFLLFTSGLPLIFISAMAVVIGFLMA